MATFADPINKLMDNPYKKILIQWRTGKYEGNNLQSVRENTIEAFLKSDFTVGMSSGFGDGDPNIFDQAIQTGEQAVNAGKQLGVWEGGITKTGSSIGTVANWTGGSPFTFDLDLVFVRTKNEEKNSILNTIHKFNKLVFPQEVDRNKGGLYGLVTSATAPLGYNPKVNGIGATGTVSVQIGNFFRMNNLLVESYSAVLPDKVTYDGSPLYAEVTVSFRSVMMMDVKDINDCFALINPVEPPA